jgi:putative GTP pyrophosphokinase
MDWEVFLYPYRQAVDELKIKFKGIREQCLIENKHSPVEFVTGRVKPIGSILDKMKKKNLTANEIESEIQDIAGLRIMCQFVDDIYAVIEMMQKRKDFDFVEVRDYITHKKPSGYRSFHVVISYPVQTVEGEKRLLVEVQIRTLAMNFWATIEHSLNYKYGGAIPKNIEDRLKRAAEAASRLDEEMSLIKGEIQEAQKIFELKENRKRT